MEGKERKNKSASAAAFHLQFSIFVALLSAYNTWPSYIYM
jgi:hypothetical protein